MSRKSFKVDCATTIMCAWGAGIEKQAEGMACEFGLGARRVRNIQLAADNIQLAADRCQRRVRPWPRGDEQGWFRSRAWRPPRPARASARCSVDRGRDNPLSPLAASQAFLDEMIRAPIHRIAHLGPKPAAAERWVLGEKLPVDPGAVTWASMLRSDRVASDKRFRPLASS